MRITLELELEATYFERDNGDVRLEMLCFPGSCHNIMPWLSSEDVKSAQFALDNAWEQALIDKAAAIAERREMAGDIRRERARDDKMTGDFTYSQWKI